MNIIIAYGGKSCEHDISVITACLAKGYFNGNIYSVYFTKNNECYLVDNDWTPKQHIDKKLTKKAVFVFGEKKLAIYKGKRVLKYVDADVVVNCCHGLHGEDGSLAAICGMCNIPMVGSNLISSAVAIDKTLTKTVLQSLQMPVVKGVAVTKTCLTDMSEITSRLNFPIIVKPSLLGSSIGVEIAHSEEELKKSLLNAFKFDGKVLCEEALTDFYELNCAAMKIKNNVLTGDVDCPYTMNDILTFNDKYISNEAYDRKRKEIPEDTVLEVKRLTERIYTELNFSGVIRVDYLFDNKNCKLLVNEINTIPGSLAYGLWEGKFTRTEYGEALVEEAVRDFRELQNKVYVFDSGVLSFGGIKK